MAHRRLPSVPLLRQLRGDPLARGAAARSRRSEDLRPRTAAAGIASALDPAYTVGPQRARLEERDGAD